MPSTSSQEGVSVDRGRDDVSDATVSASDPRRQPLPTLRGLVLGRWCHSPALDRHRTRPAGTAEIDGPIDAPGEHRKTSSGVCERRSHPPVPCAASAFANPALYCWNTWFC